MKKRLLACLLVLAMVIGLIPGIAAAEKVTFPLKEEITLTVFVLGDYQDTYVTQWIKEKTNINLEFVNTLSGNDGKTKLNLMLYGGDELPDIFISTAWTKAECMMYGAEGIVIPLNEYLKDAEVWNALNEECPARYGDLVMSDGNIYTYGDTNECFHCTHQARMWVYQPWIDQLNDGKLPTTTDELYEYLLKVKTMDPNGNGKADEIPLTGYLDGWATDPFVFVSNAFVQNNNFISNTNPTIAGGFVVDGNKVKYNLITDEYRDALRYMNKLYAEGLLDAQAYTQTGDQANAALSNEDHLIAVMGCGVPVETAGFFNKTEGPWQDWTLLPPLKGPDGVQLSYTSLNSYFGSCIGLVSADCEYPEIAVALFDLLASPEGTRVQRSGVEGINWKWTNELPNLVGGESTWVALVPDKRLEDGSVDWAAYGYSFLSPTWASDACISGQTAAVREGEGVENPDMNSEALLYKWAQVYDQYAADVNTIVPNMPYTEEQSRKISEYTVSVGAYANSATIRFITGDLNIETDWEAYLAEMEKMDVKGYVNVMQEAYATYLNSITK